MKVSIITVCYNSADFIGSAVESVLAQDYENIEYIVIDGASQDTTVDVVKSLAKKNSRTIHITTEKDRGIYDAMNKGLSLATGEIVGFLNADDVLDGSSVISGYVRMFQSSHADIVFADLDYVDRQQTDRVLRKWKSGALPRSGMRYGWHPAHPTFYVRRSVYKEFGVFDLNFKIAADYELMLRFMQRYRVKAVYLPQKSVRMRAGGVSNGSLKNIIKANWECLLAWKKNELPLNPLTVPGKLFWKFKQLL
jgi:glycosyltransferase